MSLKSILTRLGLVSGWSQELALAAFTLVLGFAVMPLLIFLAGSSALGRYDGASAPRIYDSIFQSLVRGSVASWIVVLGPYGFYLLFKALRYCWRAGGRLA